MTGLHPIERQLSLARQGLTPSSQLRQRVRGRFGASEAAPAALMRAGSALQDRWRALRASGNLGLAVGVGLFGLGCIVGLLGSDLVLQARDEAAMVARPHTDALAAPAVTPAAPSVLPPPAAPSLVTAPTPLASDESLEGSPATQATAAPPSAALAPAANARERAPASFRSGIFAEVDAAQGRRAAPRAAPRPAKRAVPGRDWRGQLELLERAERAVRADNVALALALLSDFDARYPESRLVEERAAVETMAHCQVQATDSSARASRFLKLYPTSLYRARVEALCHPETPSSPAPSPAATDTTPL